ncbi:MAG: hypothetical protein ACOCWS_00845 [Alkalispirochaetaceae bacterium]
MKLANLFAPGAGRYLLAAGALSMFAMGASQALYGPFFSYFGETLGVTPSRLGMLPGLHFAGATAGILAGFLPSVHSCSPRASPSLPSP